MKIDFPLFRIVFLDHKYDKKMFPKGDVLYILRSPNLTISISLNLFLNPLTRLKTMVDQEKMKMVATEASQSTNNGLGAYGCLGPSRRSYPTTLEPVSTHFHIWENT